MLLLKILGFVLCGFAGFLVSIAVDEQNHLFGISAVILGEIGMFLVLT